MQGGGDLRTLSEILGHANVAFTMQVYVCSDMQTKKKYMDMMERMLQPFCEVLRQLFHGVLKKMHLIEPHLELFQFSHRIRLNNSGKR